MIEKKRMVGSLAVDEKYHRVITIAPTEPKPAKKLRVAAYARVSTDSSDQLNSFSAQMSHFSDLISREKTWELADIYADEGITGTSAEKRGDFQRLLADCRRGLVDRVLVKSISRFARNTKECLEAVRELKALGVGVFFEKENIDTSAMSSEMMMALFASLAQEESRNISQNMRWSYLRRMEKGEYVPCNLPYGYVRSNGEIEIHTEQAKVIQRIFREYLAGESVESIAKGLNEDSIPCKSGEAAWGTTVIRYILTNEKYMGDSLWQKYYTTDTMPFVCKRNHGERAAFYAQGTHAGIVPAEVFRAANSLIKQRAKQVAEANHQAYPFRKKLFCGDCGAVFRRKVVRGKIYWVCIGRVKKRTENCQIPPIPERGVERSFLRLYFNLKHGGVPILSRLAADLRLIRERKLLWSPDIIELNTQISDLSRQNHTLAELHAQGLVDPDIFISQANALTKQLREVKLQKERLLSADSNDTLTQTQALIAALSEGPEMLTEFDAELFDELIDRIIVEDHHQLRFRLRNGLELTEAMERTVR